jgi:hypothetical protein
MSALEDAKAAADAAQADLYAWKDDVLNGNEDAANDSAPLIDELAYRYQMVAFAAVMDGIAMLAEDAAAVEEAIKP